jgi:hypothetical protein
MGIWQGENVSSLKQKYTNFKEIKMFPHNEAFAYFKNDSKNRKIRYFYNEFGNKVQPKEIVL